MTRAKLFIALIFVAAFIAALATESFGYPPFVAKARKFGAKDCTFCHVDELGGPPWNDRGKWLIAEKARRKADAIDADWLADYKPGASSQKSSSSEQKSAASPLEQELVALYNELIEGGKKRDTAPFARIMADDYSEINAEGQIINKAAVLGAIPNYELESLTLSEVSTRVLGDTAIMTLRQVSKGKFQGNDIAGDFRETIIWVKRDGRWQMTAAHITRLPSK
ncbi:MAG TPA: nuclear transport factor 2 family protein [Blastocatellia bacterium]|nr:nuclear transport factor 2 family protein [Blastocatellia bacterium]